MECLHRCHRRRSSVILVMHKGTNRGFGVRRMRATILQRSHSSRIGAFQLLEPHFQFQIPTVEIAALTLVCDRRRSDKDVPLGIVEGNVPSRTRRREWPQVAFWDVVLVLVLRHVPPLAYGCASASA